MTYPWRKELDKDRFAFSHGVPIARLQLEDIVGRGEGRKGEKGSGSESHGRQRALLEMTPDRAMRNG